MLVYDKQRQTPGLSGVDIGYALVRREAVERMPAQNGNFEALVYPALAREGKLYAAFTEHRYYSIGSWERIALARAFFSPRKFAFLDRDGTLNERAPRAQYITTPEAFIWLPGARQAVRKLKEAGYTVLLFTNQPGVARGAMTEADLAAVHEKMRRELQAGRCGHRRHLLLHARLGRRLPLPQAQAGPALSGAARLVVRPDACGRLWRRCARRGGRPRGRMPL